MINIRDQSSQYQCLKLFSQILLTRNHQETRLMIFGNQNKFALVIRLCFGIDVESSDFVVGLWRHFLEAFTELFMLYRNRLYHLRLLDHYYSVIAESCHVEAFVKNKVVIFCIIHLKK